MSEKKDKDDRCGDGHSSNLQPSSGKGAGVDRGVSRRSIAKAGVSAPILMSLFSRPAWGVACSPSSLASGNASGRHENDCDGNGCTPGFWKNNTAAWLGTGYSPGACTRWQGNQCKEWNTAGATKFFDVFLFHASIPSSNPAQVTLLEVMLEHEKAGNLGTYENHLVAALLNAAKAPFLYGTTVEQIIELARAVHNGTTYQGQMVSQSEYFSLLVRMNESGTCFLNAHGQCGSGYVEFEGQCIPCCSQGWRFDINSGSCIKDDEWDSDIHTGP
jgi:nitrite reductase/ring-hydroxylating ferredoxin subunit